MKIKNRTILIIGGSSGIGLELARELIRLDNTVIITGRDNEKLLSIKNTLPVINICKCDITNNEDIEKMYNVVIKDFPNVDIIINSAGIMKVINFEKEDYQNICDEIDTNLSGMIKVNQRFISHLIQHENAGIVNISSGLAFIPFETTPIYSTSKAGVHMYSKVLRKQLRKTGIKVFEVAPPKTSQSMIDKINSSNDDKKKFVEMEVSVLVQKIIAGIEKERFEIKPSFSKGLRFVGRIIS